MPTETVTIIKKKHPSVKKMKNVDLDLLQQLIGSFKDIKEGKVYRVK